MRKIEKYTVPAHEATRTTEITCDICGVKKPHPNSDSWSGSQYEIEEVTIKARIGSSFPEGGSGSTVEYDICLKCMDEKIVPFLRTLGAHPRETDWET